jgi:plastocyanin
MNKNTMIALVVIAVLVLGGGALLAMNQNTTPAPTTQPSETPSTQGSASVVNLTVESNGLNFTPNTITVKQGQTVNLTYKNNMGRHDWVLDKFNAKTALVDAGKQETISFIASEAGTYEFYCSVAGHRESGMKGTFIVE